MTESNQSTVEEMGASIRMVGVNSDKTRRVAGSDVVYQVYIELSAAPPLEWGTLFDGEWKMLNATQPKLWEAANIDRKFLVMRCPLKDVATVHLAFLKKAIAGTNTKYDQYIQEQATEHEQRQDVWERERSAVDAMIKTLQF